MNILIKELENLGKFKEYVSDINKKISPIVLSGLSSVGKIQLLEATKEFADRNICIVTYNELQAKKIYKDLKYFSGNVVYFPKREIASYDYVAESKDLPYERIETLNKIFEQEKSAKKNENRLIVITTIEAMMQKMISKEEVYKALLEFKVGKCFNLEELKQSLIHLGYERADIVDGKGQFSVRGGILDIGTTNTQGVRIEFWGDEVDSIRSFSITSQRSNKMIEEARIYPSHELIVTKNIDEICKQIETKKENASEENAKNITEDIELIRNGDYISKVDKYFNEFYDKQSSFMEYIGEDYLICLDDIEKINVRQENIINDNNQLIETLLEKDRIVPDSIKNIAKYDVENVENQLIYLYETDLLSDKNTTKFSANVFNFKYRDMHFFKSELNILTTEIKKALDENKRVIVLAGNEAGSKKIEALLEPEEIKYKYFEKLEDSQEKIYKNSIEEYLKNKTVIISNGSLSSGFENYETNVMVITGEDFIASEPKKKKHTDSFKQGEKVVFADLRAGDYVVHKTQGIGIYIGVNTITTADGITKDYIKVKYKNDDVLYVPTDMLDNIRKYVGGGDGEPKLNKLGSTNWEKTKKYISEKVKDISRELILLYKKRLELKKKPYKDYPEEEVFASEFKYNLTPDQKKAVVEINNDLKKDNPMDRLLCGDVGFGKTEVAMRAMFKAVLNNEQVLYLCPTTILSKQQYNVAKERFKNWPIEIALLNRHVSARETHRILEDLKRGKIDILFGTHRILSDDIVCKNLGMLVVDEEQRFGVTHKEKIKTMKSDVNVLTLSATPIPRTLKMAMSGLRDLSVIDTPPVNRYPVQTYVAVEDDFLIKDAIYKELARKGQIFILYNRVETIEKYMNHIHELVPDAKINFAHGKMEKDELDNIMTSFINNEFDILICTTIIESGIDIPNVNTLIIHDADNFGLSQLYQIRGRVGRSNKIAYAYLMYEKNKMLNDIAIKRLNTIKEFTELGSGYRIAMRDLSLRGAGDIFGASQAGFVDSVGISLYMKMIEDEIKRQQGEFTPEEDKETQALINVSTHISDTYVTDEDIKIEIHQKINEIDSYEKMLEIKNELEDRFGKVTADMLVYMYEEWFEKLAKKYNIKQVVQTDRSIEITLPEDVSSNIKGDKLLIEAMNLSRSFNIKYVNKKISILLYTKDLPKHFIFYIVTLLEKIL